MTSTDTQYIKINILAADRGDEVLRAGEWRAIAHVEPMSRGRVGIKFADGGTTVQPIHHLDGAVRRPVVTEVDDDRSDREVIDAAVEAHAAVVREQDAKPVQGAVRKTVTGSQLRAGDVLLSGEILSQELAGWQVASIRPHTSEGALGLVYHVTTEDRRGSKVTWTCLPDDRFEIERTLTADDVEAEAAFPPIVEAWELVVEAAIETEGEDAAYGERKPSMVNVRRQLAMMVVGERRAKEVAAELAEQFKAERDAAHEQLAKVTAQRDAARAAVDRTNESRVMWREEYKKTLALLGNRDQRIQATERALDRLAATIATDTIERGGAHALDVAARLVSQLHTVSDILREGE